MTSSVVLVLVPSHVIDDAADASPSHCFITRRRDRTISSRRKRTDAKSDLREHGAFLLWNLLDCAQWSDFFSIFPASIPGYSRARFYVSAPNTRVCESSRGVTRPPQTSLFESRTASESLQSPDVIGSLQNVKVRIFFSDR